MPKLKNYGKGRRVSVWIPERHLSLWDEIENKSKFASIALDNAVAIMTFALLKKADPAKYDRDKTPVEAVLPSYNEQFPLDPLTAKRLGKTKTWPKTSPNEQELW